MSDPSKTKICDPCAAGCVYKYVWLETRQYGGNIKFGTTTHSLEITMKYVAGVENAKSFGDIGQLVEGVRMVSTTKGGTPTRQSRSASGCLLICSMRFPPGIHSEISWRGDGVIPRKGTMFWCSKRFHIIASWYKVCVFVSNGRHGKL